MNYFPPGFQDAIRTDEIGDTQGQFMPSNPPGMRQQGVGVSANDLSRNQTQSQTNAALIAAAKSGGRAEMDALAKAHAEMMTKHTEAMAKAEAEGVSENQTRDEMMSGTTLNTFIPKNHISSMILYLCSDAGSTITGQAISVDGGLESVP